MEEARALPPAPYAPLVLLLVEEKSALADVSTAAPVWHSAASLVVGRLLLQRRRGVARQLARWQPEWR
jgi:hypothetical protein